MAEEGEGEFEKGSMGLDRVDVKKLPAFRQKAPADPDGEKHEARAPKGADASADRTANDTPGGSMTSAFFP